MNDTYFKELFHILCFIFFDNSLEKENKYNEIYEKYFSEKPITADKILFVSYCREVKNSLFQLNDNNSREAYLSDTFFLLSHSEYFEQNKDLIKGMNDIYEHLPIEDLLKVAITEEYKKQPVYNKLLHSLFKEMFLLECSIKEFCNDFTIDFNKLAKKYNHNYDFEKLMYYIKTGENVPPQPKQPPVKTSAAEQYVKENQNKMDFFKNAEVFFNQLQYCLGIDPEPAINTEHGLMAVMLKPEIFFELTAKYGIKYPVIHENNIIELVTLMKQDNIEKDNAIKFVNNLKLQYWGTDNIIMFPEVEDQFRISIKNMKKDIIEGEIFTEYNINFRNYLLEKRTQIFNDLIEAIKKAGKTSAAEPLKADKANSIEPVETTEQKVRRILAPLKEIGSDGVPILSENNFDILVKTYCNWIEKQETPNHREPIVFYGSNKDFYKHLRKLNTELNISKKELAPVLQYILTENTDAGKCGEPVKVTTILKNLRTKKYK